MSLEKRDPRRNSIASQRSHNSNREASGLSDPTQPRCLLPRQVSDEPPVAAKLRRPTNVMLKVTPNLNSCLQHNS
jgi:hypothetical protein